MKADNKFYFIIMTIYYPGAWLPDVSDNKPFLSPIMWAIVLSILFYPVYAFIHKYVKYKSVASLLIYPLLSSGVSARNVISCF